MKNENPVILFDGYCNLCNRTVDFIIRRDKKHHFRFLSLQDPRVNDIFHVVVFPVDIDSLILAEGNKIYSESDAAIRIAMYLAFPWNSLVILKIIPKKLRDSVYRLIARNRYRWFGKRKTCRIPGPGEQERFL